MKFTKAFLPLALALGTTVSGASAALHGDDTDNLAEMIANKGLDKAWSVNVVSDVFENEHLYMGAANYKATWTPAANHRASRCPSGNPGGVFQAMYDDQVARCANYVQTGILDAPKTLHRTFEGCGCAELVHTDLLKNAAYEDKWAVPGFAACAGKDKLFALTDINPLVEQFCTGFAEKASTIAPGAKVTRTFNNIAYEIEPLFAIPNGHDDEKRGAQTTNIHIFAAYDQKACRTPQNRVWPTKARCIESVTKAVEASSVNGICSYECSLSHAKNGDWELNYCQNFHALQEDKTTGGYFWADCFRWGVVDDLEEGILGAIVL
ncbi:hypothetical protein F5X68DRAFT_192385 [Plectosphaerella plurivora]|uniref:Uncharacterized protein n=1 Tax=Plectosphaerella plurivora TaxID=936078 RepID=A0A9P8V7V8_9PEZI|nr:hypothetical protein F5X68DRAFT_192385 [Plectosphaerella plurivora]